MVANVLNWRGDDIQGGGKSPLICSTGGWGGGSINHEFAHKMLANDGDSYRRKATFLTSDEFFYDEELCGWKSDATCTTRAQKEKDPERGITNTYGSFSRSDVMEVKMMMHPNDADLSVGDNCNNTNLCIARLGEAYLIYAEAILGNNPSTDDADAMEYFNKVRKRAGLEPQNSITYEDIRRERRLELCLEGQYWYDLVRRAYYKQQEVLNYITGQDRGTAIPVVWDADTQTLKRDEDSDETKRAIGDVDSSIFLLPYPESETVQNPLLKADPMPYAFKEDRITDLFN